MPKLKDTPMTDIQRYKVRRWTDCEYNEWDLAMLDKHPDLLEWEPARLYDGTVRPHPKSYNDGGDNDE